MTKWPLWITPPLATRTPIVPFGFVGGGDAMPTIANLTGLGRVLGVPYIPLTKYLLPVPKPTTFQLVYSTPMRFEGDGSEPDEIVLGYVEQVRARIAWLIEQGRSLRDGHIVEHAPTVRL